MENRDKSFHAHSDNLVSPIDSKIFYFPCGSISSFYDSVDFQDIEDKDESLCFKKYQDSEDTGNEPLTYITYEPASYEKSGDVYQALSQPDSPHSKIKSLTIDTAVNTFETFQDLESSNKRAELLERMYQDASTQLEKTQTENKELIKQLRCTKSELIIVKDKLKAQEVEFLKLKLIVDDIVDDEDSYKTTRGPEKSEVGFENIKAKLGIIKKKILRFGKIERSSNCSREKLIRESRYNGNIKVPGFGGLEAKGVEIKARGRENGDEIRTERPKSSMASDYEITDRITYKDVLRDLKEITSRASKALKNSSLNRRSSNCSSLKNLEKEKPARYEINNRKYCKN